MRGKEVHIVDAHGGDDERAGVSITDESTARVGEDRALVDEGAAGAASVVACDEFRLEEVDSEVTGPADVMQGVG